MLGCKGLRWRFSGSLCTVALMTMFYFISFQHCKTTWTYCQQTQNNRYQNPANHLIFITQHVITVALTCILTTQLAVAFTATLPIIPVIKNQVFLNSQKDSVYAPLCLASYNYEKLYQIITLKTFDETFSLFYYFPSSISYFWADFEEGEGFFSEVVNFKSCPHRSLWTYFM